MTRRGPVLAFVLAVLVLGAGVDRHRAARPAVVTTREPRAASSAALSSSWYCTGGTAAPGGVADATVLVANAGSRALTGTVTFVPSQGDQRQVPLEVPASARVAVRAQDVVAAPFVSALIELDGGQAAAEMGVTGALGPSASPCASSGSNRWYFAEGVTTKDAVEVVSVFNPFPEDAIIDMTFGTEEGTATPEALAGLVVKGRRMLSVNVGDFVHRRQAVAASVEARVGRVVAERLETFDGSAGRKGISLALGAPGTQKRWYFPDGLVADGVTERYQIFNPFRREAAVHLDLSLERGDAEPLELLIPAGQRLTVTANNESRIPKGVAHAAVVNVTGGEGVVVERTIETSPPAPRQGVAWTLGADQPARRWAFAAGGADDTVDEWITLHNPGSAAATASLVVLADGDRLPVEGLQDIPLAPGQRLSVRLGDHLKRPATPLVVTASGPIVAERALYLARAPGTVMTLGIPL